MGIASAGNGQYIDTETGQVYSDPNGQNPISPTASEQTDSGAVSSASGTASGGGTPADTGINAANAYWQQVFGRPLQQNEIDWLTSTRGDLGKVSVLDAAKREATKRQNYATNIQQQAAAYGLDLKPQQINQILDNSFRTGDPSADTNFGGLVQANLSRLATEKAKTDVQNQISAANNPTVSQDNRDAVDRTFEQLLGRHPSEDERQHFAKEIAQGLSPYELGQALQGSQEYQDARASKQQAAYTQQAQQASQALNDQLMQTQQTTFNNALPEIISSFQRAGRIGSSGVQNAIAKQQALLDQQRQQTLANINYQTTVQGLGYNQQNFVNSQNQAFQNYLNQQGVPLAQQYNVQNAQNSLNYNLPFQTLQMQQGYGNQLLGRQQQVQDYNTQRQDYQNDFNRYLDSQKQAAIYGLAGNLVGSGANIGMLKLAGAF